MLADFMLNDFAEGAKHLKICKILLDLFPFNFNRYTNSLNIRWQIIFSILYVVNILKKNIITSHSDVGKWRKINHRSGNPKF